MDQCCLPSMGGLTIVVNLSRCLSLLPSVTSHWPILNLYIDCRIFRWNSSVQTSKKGCFSFFKRCQKTMSKNDAQFQHVLKSVPTHLVFFHQKTRWSPRTRMPTRMLRNRDDTYFSHFPANPLVRHPELTHWGDTLVGHLCLTLLRNALVRHSCLTLLLDTLVRHSYSTLLTWHSCTTLLLVRQPFIWHSCKTALLDNVTRHSYLTLLTWHSCKTLL